MLNRSVVHFADTTTSVACRVVRYTPKPPDELAALEREQPGIARLCHFVYVVANVGFGVALLLFLDMSSQVAGSLAAGTLSVIEVLFFIAISAACYLAATKRQEVTAAWRSALFDEWIGVEALPAKAIRS